MKIFLILLFALATGILIIRALWLFNMIHIIWYISDGILLIAAVGWFLEKWKAPEERKKIMHWRYWYKDDLRGKLQWILMFFFMFMAGLSYNPFSDTYTIMSAGIGGMILCIFMIVLFFLVGKFLQWFFFKLKKLARAS